MARIDFAFYLAVRDIKGISKLPKIQLILPYKISCERGSSEILNYPKYS